MRNSLSKRLIAVLLMILTATSGLMRPVLAETCFGEDALRARLEHVPETIRTRIVDAYAKCLDVASWSNTLDKSARTGAIFGLVAALGAFFISPTLATFLTTLAVAGLGAAALRALYGRIEAGLAESDFEQTLVRHTIPITARSSETSPTAAQALADRSIPSLDDLPNR